MAESAPPLVRLREPAAAPPAREYSTELRDLLNAPGAGQSLSTAVQEALESSLQVDLRPVRVHDDPRTAAIVDRIPARAFTYGNHVFLGSAASAHDVVLMGHEVAHVVQQQGRATVQVEDRLMSERQLEDEAERSGRSAAAGRGAPVRGRTGGQRVQGSGLAEWIEERAWGFVERYAPDLVPILRQGVLEWLKEKIGAAVQTLVDTLTAPVRAVTGVAAALAGHFANLLAWIRDAAARIARGDCSAFSEAAEKIQQVIAGLAAPVIDRIKAIAARVKGFFEGLWNRFGAPAWEFLRGVGGAIWDRIQRLGAWIWEKTAPIRRALERAWRWVKNRLGVGEGPEGQNGLLQWVQQKASAAWEWVKERIRPIQRPLMVVAGVLVMLSPAGPIIAIGAAVGGLLYGLRWIRQHMATRNGVVDQRSVLERSILPAIMGAVNGVTAALTRAATFVTGKLNQVMGGLGDLVGAVAGSFLRFAVGIVRWIADQFRALVNWATEQLMALAQWVSGALDRLRRFLEPVLSVLRQIGQVVGNILQLPMLVLGRLWRMIPACIRNPFVDFLVNRILRQIPIVREIVAAVEVWPRIRAEAMRIIRMIFTTGDLSGALLAILRALLRVLNVPVDLVRAIFEKAMSALDLILANPFRLLRNVLQTLKQGFVLFFGNVLRHLLNGLRGWLFGELSASGVEAPTDISVRSILRLVVQILDITLERVLQRLQRRIGAERVAQIRRMISALQGAWEWVRIAITEGVPGIWRKVQERLADLWNQLLNGIIGWLTTNIIQRVTARLLSMLDPTGIMAVVNAIIALYRAVQSFVEQLARILAVINRVLDSLVGIASGMIAPAAAILEDAMDRALPVMISFLANQIGLRGLGRRLREIIEFIREKVNQAIDWLIDLALRVGRALLNLGRAAINSVVQWWREKRRVRRGETTITLEFEGPQERAEFVISSSPKVNYRSWLENRVRPYLPASPATHPMRVAYANALVVGQRITDNIARTNLTAADSANLIADLNAMADLIAGLPSAASRVPSQIQYGPLCGGEGGTKTTARVLTGIHGGVPGSTPVDEPRIWDDVKNRKNDRNVRAYIRGHQLNENLHGPGRKYNMTPITEEANSAHKNGIEKKMKETVLDNNEIAYYEITVDGYGTHPESADYKKLKAKGPARTGAQNIQFRIMEADRRLARFLKFKAWTLLPQPDGTYQKGVDINYPPVESEIPTKAPRSDGSVPIKRLTRVALNNPGPTRAKALEALKELYEVGDARAPDLYNGRPYTNWADVIARNSGITQAVVDRWKSPGTDDPQVGLNGATTWENV